MLDTLRRGASGWVAKILMALLILSFGVWGIADVFTGFRSGVVASVGSTDISETAFRTAYDRELQRFSQQGLGSISREQAARFGFPAQVLSRLAQEATLDEAARRLNLSMSMDQVLGGIVDDPALRPPNRPFSRELFLLQLREWGVTEDSYIRDRGRDEVRRQFADAAAGEIPVPRAYMEAIHRYREEERVLRYVLLEPPSLGTIEDPAPDVLAKYYDERKGAFRAPETRVVEILALDQPTLLAASTPTEEEVRAAYDRAPGRYSSPERRRVLQIPFASRADADAALERIRSGAITFEGLQAELKVSREDADLGLRPRNGFFDPTVAEAAFKLDKDQVSDVIMGRFRPLIIKLVEVAPEVSKTFDDVKAEIATALAREKAQARLPDLRNKVEEARDAGTALPEIATSLGLPLRKVEIDREGKGPDGNVLADLPGGTALVTKIFETDVGLDNVPLPLGVNGLVFYKVVELKPARDQPLDEVRDRVLAQWRIEETRARLAKAAGEILERVKRGETLEAVAESRGLAVVTTDKVKRSQTDNELAPAFGAAFEVPEGQAVIGKVNDDKLLVILVQDVFPTFYGETEQMKQIETELQRQVQDALLGSVIRELQTSIGITINQAALERAAGVTPN